jgi:predicted TIM-barrel fold metal-dependent hydrolase
MAPKLPMPARSNERGWWALSSDNHVVEPPDLFTTRFQRSLRDSAPTIVVGSDGRDMWQCEGEEAHPVTSGARAGDRYLDVADRPPRLTFEDGAPAASYEPVEWLKGLEAEGIFGGVVQCGVLTFYGTVKSVELMNEICRVFNDWILEFASADPARIKPVTMLNLDDLDWAIAEAQRTYAAGAAAFMIPIGTGLGYESAAYDKFWAAAEELGLPLQLHIGTVRHPMVWRPYLRQRAGMVNWPDYQVRMTLTQLIVSGVLDRYPHLKFVSVENEGSWVPYFLQRIDWHYTNNARWVSEYRLRDGRLPSDVFRENVWIGFTEDPILVQLRDMVGADRLMWGSDFPHGESTYPASVDSLDTQFAGVPDAEQRLMAQTTTAMMYGFDVPELARQD